MYMCLDGIALWFFVDRQLHGVVGWHVLCVWSIVHGDDNFLNHLVLLWKALVPRWRAAQCPSSQVWSYDPRCEAWGHRRGAASSSRWWPLPIMLSYHILLKYHILYCVVAWWPSRWTCCMVSSWPVISYIILHLLSMHMDIFNQTCHW